MNNSKASNGTLEANSRSNATTRDSIYSVVRQIRCNVQPQIPPVEMPPVALSTPLGTPRDAPMSLLRVEPRSLLGIGIQKGLVNFGQALMYL